MKIGFEQSQNGILRIGKTQNLTVVQSDRIVVHDLGKGIGIAGALSVSVGQCLLYFLPVPMVFHGGGVSSRILKNGAVGSNQGDTGIGVQDHHIEEVIAILVDGGGDKLGL